jgi:AICAR transformylase/IMP cyclohydrolase PurH
LPAISDGLQQVRVVNAFGVRIVIQPVGSGSDEEISEDDFREKYKFVSD